MACPWTMQCSLPQQNQMLALFIQMSVLVCFVFTEAFCLDFFLANVFCRSFMSKNKRPIIHHMAQIFSFLVMCWSSFLDFKMIQTCETRARETYTLYWKLSRWPLHAASFRATSVKPLFYKQENRLGKNE